MSLRTVRRYQVERRSAVQSQCVAFAPSTGFNYWCYLSFWRNINQTCLLVSRSKCLFCRLDTSQLNNAMKWSNMNNNNNNKKIILKCAPLSANQTVIMAGEEPITTPQCLPLHRRSNGIAALLFDCTCVVRKCEHVEWLIAGSGGLSVRRLLKWPPVPGTRLQRGRCVCGPQGHDCHLALHHGKTTHLRKH